MYNNNYNFPYNNYYNYHNRFENHFIKRIVSNKKINWNSMLNTTSRTLGLINQTIPIIKEVRPIYNNMKQLFKIASIFKEETSSDNKKDKLNKEDSNDTIINNNYSNIPNFFI